VLLDKGQKQRDLKINEQNQGKMPGTTVAQKLNQGSPRLPIAIGIGGIKRPAPFLGTFLGEQKGTKTKTEFI
jgi:hypothetical protein